MTHNSWEKYFRALPDYWLSSLQQRLTHNLQQLTTT